MFKLSARVIKILKTCNLYLCFWNLGLCLALPGPCLLDLQKIVNTDTKHIGFIYTTKAIGYLVGSVAGGIVLDAVKCKQFILMISNFLIAVTMLLIPWIRSIQALTGLMVITGLFQGTLDTGGIILDLVKSKQAVLTLLNFVVGASMLAIPWSTNLGLLAGFMIINGVSLGTVDIGGNVICLTLWGGDSAPYYQALHFTFGAGGLVAPLIAAQFLGDHSNEFDGITSNNMSPFNLTMDFPNITTGFFNSNIYNSSVIDESRIIYPFTIIGMFGLFVTIMFLAICIVSPTEEKKPKNANSKEIKTSIGFLAAVVFLNFLLLFVETGTEIGYAQMLTTYVVKGRLKLSNATGSYMTSVFWAAFTVARLASVFLAIKFSSFTLIVWDLAITLVGSFVLFFLSSYEWAIWLASVLLGVGIASFFPAAIAWLDSYINVTNKLASIFTVGAAFGEMAIPFTISYYIETVPDILAYIVPVSSVSSSLIVMILYFILRKREKKVQKEETECYVVGTPTMNT